MSVDSKLLEEEAEVELQYTDKKPSTRKRKLNQKLDNNGNVMPEKLVKRIKLYLTKPSTLLVLAPKIGSKVVRWENRVRLSHLLRKLVKRRNWVEVGGVLSMLLKASCKDRYPLNNRFKYSVSMELLKHMKSDRIKFTKIRNIYDIWMRKNGSMKEWPIEDRYLVHFEFILFCLTQGNVEEAHQAAICLKQEQELDADPMSNMVMGLTFYELWYSTIPEEMRWRDSDLFSSRRHSEIMETRFSNPVENSMWCSANDTHKADIPIRCDSDTSVMKDKKISSNADINQNREVSMDADVSLQNEHPMQNFQPQEFSMNSDEITGNEASFSKHGDHMQYASNFYSLRGLETWLLPLQLPDPEENCEDLINLHRGMLNDYYMDAIKYFQLALYSTPPLLVALLPLVQLLLIGGQFDEALKVLEKLCCKSNTALPIRLRTSLLEHFDRNNCVLLSTCFEDILKKDPTCSNSLAKLVRMHQNGDYCLESLLEMIALHLDSTYAECNTWKEFALCFLKLSQYEEDQMSVCTNKNEDGQEQTETIYFSKTPRIFTKGKSGKSWRLRCRWWLTRHFSNNMLVSEIAAGDLQLLTYKAACASHMYGEEFNYVVEAHNCLGKENDRDLLLFLQTHMENSIGIYTNFLN
ncbi:hypothetical protein RGQ29_005990 [Quercus rubra]|uniref:Uncharacterized protein n=1 Tax=Quercus rubra TaxID=3512 RepID=A0AAN7E6F0_QUERU|nr:hypothetical protein RGQ29_005990 [Quercus rubra]KAK4563663.1 hypothetical protein RGQ29_005990 [Quercus rubra]